MIWLNKPRKYMKVMSSVTLIIMKYIDVKLVINSHASSDENQNTRQHVGWNKQMHQNIPRKEI